MTLIHMLRHYWRTMPSLHLLWMLLLGLLLPNIILTYSPYLSIPAKIANLIIPAGLYLLLLLTSNKPGKVVVLGLPLVLAINMFQSVLFSVFSGEVIAVDMLLNLVSASSDEAGELLGGLILPILLTLVWHVVLIILAIKSMRSERILRATRRRIASHTFTFILAGVIPLWLAHRADKSYTIRGGLYPLNVFYNMWVAGGKLSEVIHYHETSQGFTYHAHSEHPSDMPEVYVFVLGETSRAYSWQLFGYERETNPRLSQRLSSLIRFSSLTTESNTTYKSAPIILSPADGEHSDRLPEVKGILTAMKEAGFHTVFITNQPANRSFVDFFAYEADEHYRIRDLLRAGQSLMDRKPIYDTDMLPYLDEALRKGHRKLFVVLHAYGAHWSYIDRYPREHAHFTPDDALGANALERPKLINAYDNAIRYTDYLLDEVIKRLEGLDATTALYYTADHGEDVFDDERERILHSSPSISYYQVHVPGLLWYSDRYASAFAHKLEAARANSHKPATSRSTIHTLLELTGVATPERRDSLSLMNPLFDGTRERTYLNDRYECVPLDEMLTPADLQLLQSIAK